MKIFKWYKTPWYLRLCGLPARRRLVRDPYGYLVGGDGYCWEYDG